MVNWISQEAFKKYPFLWHFNRDSVSRGVAVGLFTAVVLLIPFQTLLAIILAILLRANLPIAFLVSWVSNPITILPIAYFTSWVGNCILGSKEIYAAVARYDWNYGNWKDFGNSFTDWLMQFGKAYFVGLPIVATAFALLGYIVVYSAWDFWKRFKR